MTVKCIFDRSLVAIPFEPTEWFMEDLSSLLLLKHKNALHLAKYLL